MNLVNYNNLLNSIKSDNLLLFTQLVEHNESISFGRFPILTLCYLYKAKKIIKHHSDTLSQITNYTVINEDYSIYKEFLKYAGRTLRLYTSNNTISPIELLAIMHKDGRVKKLYNQYNQNQLISEQIQNNLKNIYSIWGQEIYFGNTELIIEKKPLSRKELRNIKHSIIYSSACALSICAIYLIIALTLGVGLPSLPYKISTEKQLLLALESNGNYVISKDITLNSPIDKITNFSGSLNGNNHTITINFNTNNNLFKCNTGTIKNLKIMYQEINKTINSSFSLLVTENRGTINNINITCNDLDLNCNKSNMKDIYINAIANTNEGTINNCNIKLSSQITTQGTGNCYMSAVVGNNTGKITNCNLIEESQITAFETDLSGIATFNDVGATIYNCRNYANLTQNSTSFDWSPNVAGIVLTNYGIIESCINFNDLKVVSTATSETPITTSTFVGGISSMNYGTHYMCLNNGNLTATTEQTPIYLGGISAYSTYYIKDQKQYFAIIENCGANGVFDASSTHENGFVFTGGIAGYLYGKASNCYSLATFVQEFTNEKYFIGNYLGAAYLEYFSNSIYLETINVIILSTDKTDFHIGALLTSISNNQTNIMTTGAFLKNGVTTYTTAEEIKTKEVYWNADN